MTYQLESNRYEHLVIVGSGADLATAVDPDLVPDSDFGSCQEIFDPDFALLTAGHELFLCLPLYPPQEDWLVD